VIGGTGQTGPLVLQGLLERSFDVVVLHGGQHEPPLPPVEHIHADAHFQQPLEQALAGRSFDLVVGMYGRARVIADVLVGKTERLVSISGITYAFSTPRDPRWGPFGVTVAAESSPFIEDPEVNRLGARVWATEQALLAHHTSRDYDVTILRYPQIYGPDAIAGPDWSLVRRILDRRPHLAVADAGLQLMSRCYRDNAAHAVLLAIDQPQVSAGQIYNVADDPPVLSLGQRADFTARALGHEWELVGLPAALVAGLYGYHGFHRVVDTTKIRTQLGYRDVTGPEEALTAAARWWASHPPERGGEFERSLPDRFDYGAEDALIARYKHAVQTLYATTPEAPDRAHPYRHPRHPGERWNADTSRAMHEVRGTDRSPAAISFPYPLWEA
jgi:nucleoside-diphosphate-sugar epimerase